MPVFKNKLTSLNHPDFQLPFSIYYRVLFWQKSPDCGGWRERRSLIVKWVMEPAPFTISPWLTINVRLVAMQKIIKPYIFVEYKQLYQERTSVILHDVRHALYHRASSFSISYYLPLKQTYLKPRGMQFPLPKTVYSVLILKSGYSCQ